MKGWLILRTIPRPDFNANNLFNKHVVNIRGTDLTEREVVDPEYSMPLEKPIVNATPQSGEEKATENIVNHNKEVEE